MRARVGHRLSSSLPALAFSMATTFATLSSAAEPPGPVVWYRASAECPSGAEFLSKLSGRPSSARLAQAGDHMDFVVTLLAAGGETLGRLERQTQNGAVAIRELRDASCSRVADALALSLTLALEPSDAAPKGAEAAPPQPAAAASASAETGQGSQAASRSASPPAGLVAPAVTAPDVPKDVRVSNARGARVSDWWLGAEGGAMTGVAPDPLGRVAVFIDAERTLRSFAPRLSFRLAAVGSLGSSSTEIGAVQRWVLGGRMEACPWSWGSKSSIRPCLAVELGATGGRGTRSSGSADAGLWAAPGAALRGALAAAPRLRFEAEAGVLFPLVRNDVYAASEALYRAQIASFYGALGISFGLP